MISISDLYHVSPEFPSLTDNDDSTCTPAEGQPSFAGAPKSFTVVSLTRDQGTPPFLDINVTTKHTRLCKNSNRSIIYSNVARSNCKSKILRKCTHLEWGEEQRNSCTVRCRCYLEICQIVVLVS